LLSKPLKMKSTIPDAVDAEVVAAAVETKVTDNPATRAEAKEREEKW